MDKVSGKLTVYFEAPFWVGVFERVRDGKLSVAKVTFGTEPKDYEVQEYIQKCYSGLKFSPAVDTGVKDIKRNPKRMQREAKRQMQETGIGTKSQQALKLQQEQNKQEHKVRRREKKEAEELRMFKLKQQKKREKHKGHQPLDFAEVRVLSEIGTWSEIVDCIIREMRSEEYCLLSDFQYEAIYIPDGIEPPPKSVIECPELQEYIIEFGNRKHDKALVAEIQGKVAGVIWVRIMNDYGHIDDDTPSLAMSVCQKYRGLGIGTLLLKQLLQAEKLDGYSKISLSVQKSNYAVKMYEKVGFTVVDENSEEYIMTVNL